MMYDKRRTMRKRRHSCTCGSGQTLLLAVIGEWVRLNIVLPLWARNTCASGTHFLGSLPSASCPRFAYCGFKSINVISLMLVYMKMILCRDRFGVLVHSLFLSQRTFCMRPLHVWRRRDGSASLEGRSNVLSQTHPTKGNASNTAA
jgi:hypothetical protein